MRRMWVFVQNEKQTPNLRFDLYHLLDDFCTIEHCYKDHDWCYVITTEHGLGLSIAFRALSALYKDVLFCTRETDWDTEDITKTWFLNGTSYSGIATVTYPDVSKDFLGDYNGILP